MIFRDLWTICVLIEHVALLVKFSIRVLIPLVPDWMVETREALDFRASRDLAGLETPAKTSDAISASQVASGGSAANKIAVAAISSRSNLSSPASSGRKLSRLPLTPARPTVVPPPRVEMTAAKAAAVVAAPMEAAQESVGMLTMTNPIAAAAGMAHDVDAPLAKQRTLSKLI